MSFERFILSDLIPLELQENKDKHLYDQFMEAKFNFATSPSPQPKEEPMPEEEPMEVEDETPEEEIPDEEPEEDEKMNWQIRKSIGTLRYANAMATQLNKNMSPDETFEILFKINADIQSSLNAIEEFCDPEKVEEIKNTYGLEEEIEDEENLEESETEDNDLDSGKTTDTERTEDDKTPEEVEEV